MEAYVGPVAVIGKVAEVRQLGNPEIALLVQPGDKVVRAAVRLPELATEAAGWFGKLVLVTGTGTWSSNGRMTGMVAQRVAPYTDPPEAMDVALAPENADTTAPGSEAGTVA